MLLYRDKYIRDYQKYAKIFVREAKRFNFKKILIHQDIDLASFLNVDGVHLTSKQLQSIPTAKLFNLFTIASTHTLTEVKDAERLGADMITFSPIFDTPIRVT